MTEPTKGLSTLSAGKQHSVPFIIYKSGQQKIYFSTEWSLKEKSHAISVLLVNLKLNVPISLHQ